MKQTEKWISVILMIIFIFKAVKPLKICVVAKNIFAEEEILPNRVSNKIAVVNSGQSKAASFANWKRLIDDSKNIR